MAGKRLEVKLSAVLKVVIRLEACPMIMALDLDHLVVVGQSYLISYHHQRQILLEVLVPAYWMYGEYQYNRGQIHLEATFEHLMTASVLPVVTSTLLKAASEELGFAIQTHSMAGLEQVVILLEPD